MKTYEEALKIAIPVGMNRALDNACRYKEIIDEINADTKTQEEKGE